MRLLFVINPIAGRQQNDWRSVIELHCGNSGCNLFYFNVVPDEDNIPLLKAFIAQHQPDRIIAAGGDGTLKMVAEAQMTQNIPIAILPSGSANGMAKELAIPNQAAAALHIAMTGRVQPIDVVEVNGEWCLHLADMGLNAKMLQHFEQSPRRGMLAYARAMLKALNTHSVMRLTVYINGQIVRRKAIMAVIANASKYGTGAVINPAGQLNDGRFELVIIRRLALSELLKMWITRQPFDPLKTELIQCTELEIESSRPYAFQVDGEYRGKQKKITARVLPAALQLVLPD